MANRSKSQSKPQPPMTLGGWLKHHEKTQTWLAQELGLSKGAVSDLISGRRTPSLELAVRLEDLTGIPARAFAEVA